MTPELDEFVVAKVQKILPFGAILALEEYGGVEAFVHISEVSSGWVRNIREHLKEGQVVVAKVIRIEPEKRQIDVSVKRVSEVERKRKLLQNKSEKRALKLLELASKKAGKPLVEAQRTIVPALTEEFGDLFTAFEKISGGAKPKAKIPKIWIDVLTEIAKKEIKPKVVNIRANISLKSFEGDGVKRVKSVALLVSKTKEASIHYLGAPNYYVEVEARDYKKAEKILASIDSDLAKAAEENKVVYSLTRPK
ncbi:MAG: translation initiation factor IF-2 subunit alpha [Candidatus Micrarchaeota archaeon]